MRCEAQDVPCGEPHKRIATKQRARIRQGKLGNLFLATSLAPRRGRFNTEAG